MIGSSGVAWWVAHAAFWVLIVWGIVTRELTLRCVGFILLLWLVGLVGFPHIPYEPVQAMFSSFVAVLDVALVFLIFKGDVRIA